MPLSVLILSEDSAKDAYDTVCVLTKKLLRQVEEQADVCKIDFEPLQNEQARRALRANLWKSTKPQDRNAIVDLRRVIATKLRERHGFVVFHFDGDRRWKERASSENVTKFDRFALPIEQLLRDSTEHRRGGTVLNDEQVRAAMNRLFRLVPFYSIEAWLYQNTKAALALCNQRHCGRHGALLKEWENDRAQLDEVTKPKERLCIGANANLRLAGTGLPVDDIIRAEKSMNDALGALRANIDLRDALAEGGG